MEDIFARLLSLTSYISRRLIHFLDDIVFKYFYRSDDVSLISAAHPEGSSSHSISESDLDGCSSPSTDPIPREAFKEELHVNARPEIVQLTHTYRGIPCIFQGLMLPLSVLRLVLRIGLASLRRFFSYIRLIRGQVPRIILRTRRTLRGSSDDIGWLQRMPGVAPVEDGTVRFLELLQDIRNGKHTVPQSLVYLLIPGLFSNHGPLYFVNTKRFFSKMGITCHIAKIHSESSVEHNARELKQYIEELYWGCGKRVMLLGHSKGGVDAAAALSLYWTDLEGKVAGLVLVQCPYGGSPLASDILREGQIADKETRRIMELIICKLIKGHETLCFQGDIRALEDLTYEKRKEFIAKHKLPEQIPLISFRSEASIAPGVLPTLSHIAHAELPWLHVPGFGDGGVIRAPRKVPVMIPMSAVMALCALHLRFRYGEKSDGFVTCRDAEVPGSVAVRPARKLDHTWMVYSPWREDKREADACEMCEALFTLLVELGGRNRRMQLVHSLK